MNEIVWLASYPKSGNTWFRVFISNLLSHSDHPVDVNELKTDGIADSREIFDELTGIEASDLTFEEIDYLRPEVYDQMAKQCKETVFIKVHDAYTCLPDERPLFPATKARVVYIIRNPLDVVVSLSHHAMTDLDTVIDWMVDRDFSMGDELDTLHSRLRQKLLDWSGHVESWVDAPELKVHVVRYEDMKTKPFETFVQAARFSGIQCDEKQVRQAVRFSDFSILQKQEGEKGFHEKPPGMPAFFRQGEAGGWRKHLSGEQVERIVRAHQRMMKRFGYLD